MDDRIRTPHEAMETSCKASRRGWNLNGEHPICGAKTRAGTPCKRWPLTFRSRCRLHGGASYSGIASPSFKHGQYSKDWLVRLTYVNLREERREWRRQVAFIKREYRRRGWGEPKHLPPDPVEKYSALHDGA